MRQAYIAQSQFSGLVKIGRSNDPAFRVRNLSGSFSEPVAMLAFFSETPELCERILHRQFRRCRMNGEWFWPSPDLIRWISNRFPTCGVFSPWPMRDAPTYLLRKWGSLKKLQATADELRARAAAKSKTANYMREWRLKNRDHHRQWRAARAARLRVADQMYAANATGTA